MTQGTDTITGAASAFVRAMTAALMRLDPGDAEAVSYVDRLVAELTAAPVSRTPSSGAPAPPPKEWRAWLANGEAGPAAELCAALGGLESALSWMPGARYWPAPEHQYFAKGLGGALLIGDAEAPFTAEDRYIALLMTVSGGTTYPLHAHRIEELYYVLSGQGEWSHDGVAWTMLPPGAAFHNAPWRPHAIRAGAEPIVAIGFYLPPYGWEGGLV